jgi:hypothetical protein
MARVAITCKPLDIAIVKRYEIFSRRRYGSRFTLPSGQVVRYVMEIDEEKLEQTVLALLYLNVSDDSERRAWKSLPWDVMDSLHQKGYISNPASKNKSVLLSEEGAKLARQLFEKLFAAS